ncbi:hypothetical protein D9M73_103440 [compost metagenome]
MHAIISLENAPRQTVRDMAETAVANRVPCTEANVFPEGCINRSHFENDYLHFQREEQTVDV